VQSAHGSFRREVALPAPIEADKTKASYRAGVLRIELTKSEEARPRRIAVQTA
jgi:HSP20 family protein